MSKKESDIRTSIRKRVKSQREYRGPIGFARAYFRHLRQYMTTGFLVWVPFFVTMWVSWWVLTQVSWFINAIFSRVLDYINVVSEQVPGAEGHLTIEYSPYVGFLMALVLFLTTGFLTRYLVWRKIIGWGEVLLGKIPFINRVYVAVRQIRDVFMGREGAVFQEVVIVEYPRAGLHVVGFVTSREQGIVQDALDKELVAVFIPTTPNPTSGFLLYVPQDELTPLGITVEESMKLIISGGAYIPGQGDEEQGEEEDGDLSPV